MSEITETIWLNTPNYSVYFNRDGLTIKLTTKEGKEFTTKLHDLYPGMNICYFIRGTKKYLVEFFM